MFACRQGRSNEGSWREHLQQARRGERQEAFHHLKGWYRSVTDTQARPCFQTMNRQTAERINLYRRRDSPRLPIHVGENLFDMRDDTPTDGEI